MKRPSFESAIPGAGDHVVQRRNVGFLYDDYVRLFSAETKAEGSTR